MAIKIPGPSLAGRSAPSALGSMRRRANARSTWWRRGLLELAALSLLVGFWGLDAAQPSLSSASTSPAPVTFSPIQPVGPTAGTWTKRIFDSEFNGSSLSGSRWTTGWSGSGITEGPNTSEQDCYDPAQVTMGLGQLDLSAIRKAETCGGVTRQFTSGLVTTDQRFSFRYGYMEARIWMPGSSSISDWPAFWADGQNWPKSGEIDTVEGKAGSPCASFINLAGGSSTCASGGFGGSWHTYAADWEQGSVTYYYDGTEVWQDTSGITSAPMYLILNLAVSKAVSAPIVAPATMRVDYVRVWQH